MSMSVNIAYSSTFDIVYKFAPLSIKMVISVSTIFLLWGRRELCCHREKILYLTQIDFTTTTGYGNTSHFRTRSKKELTLKERVEAL